MVQFQQGMEIYIFFKMSEQALGSTEPPIQWIPGTPFLWTEWVGHEADPLTYV